MSIEAGKRVIRIEAAAVAALEKRIDEEFQKAVDLIFQSKGRVIVTGVGKSGAIARKLSATLTSTGTTAYFLHAAEGAHGDLGMVHRDDIVICISKSGETEELSQILIVFKKLQIPIIALTGKRDSTLGRHAACVLDIAVTEEACPNDLAPTASTTATLAMGDALAVALLEKRNFSREDFALLHPGGSLGRQLLLTVEDVMETGDRLPFCKDNDTMKTVTIEMANKRGICPIIDSKMKLTGVITTGDLNRLVEQTEKFFHLPAGKIMNREPKFVQTGTLAAVALHTMEENRIMALPVVDENHVLKGVVHLHDILQLGLQS